MWIAGQTLHPLPGRGDFLPVVHEVRFFQSPLKEGARINTWSRVRLIEDQVASKRLAPCSEKMVKTDLEQIRRTRVTGDVPPQITIGLVGTHDHRERIPPNDR
ncbi:hypothetical protein D3C71_1549650 [compost metagenome]